MPTQYTSRTEMNRLFSAQGVEFRLDDAFSCEDDLNFFIDDASSTVDQYASQVYLPADMYTSKWVRIRTTWIACHLLSQRQGNPSLFFGRYEQILDELQRVAQQALIIPELSTREDMVPTMSNIEHDPRYREKTLRVESTVSTGSTSSKQDLSNQITPEWLM